MAATLLWPNVGQPVEHGSVTSVGPEIMERIDSTHSIWIFDPERMRFRRLPRGADPNAPSLERDWQPYFALELDDETGAFTVALNEDRTRLLRAWREPSPAAPSTTQELRMGQELRTGEVQLEPIDE
jgi:hypothetical protein